MEKISPVTGPRHKASLASATKTFMAVQLLLAFACALAEIYNRLVLGRHGVYTFPLLSKNETMWDFTIFFPAFQHFHSLRFFNEAFTFMYPAPVGVAFEIFFLLHRPLLLFGEFIVLSFLVAGILLGRALLQRGVRPYQVFVFIACSLLLSYPLWFDLKQGNIEICVWVVVSLGVWAFFRGNTYGSAACFGIAGAMKIFPFVYLGLLISRRQYRQAVFAVILATITTLVSLWLLGGNIVATWHHVQYGVDQFRTIYMLHRREFEIGFDHSLFALYKRSLPYIPTPELLRPALSAYLAITAVLGIILYFAKIRHLPIINQVICLCVASILLPPVSSDYTLMHLYVPWALLVLLAQQNKSDQNQLPGLRPAFVCFAILMSPETEFIYHGAIYGGQIKGNHLDGTSVHRPQIPF